MAATTNNPAPAAKDMPDGISVTAKDQGINQCVTVSTKELWMIRVEDHEIGTFPSCDGTDGSTKRLGTARQRIGKQSRARGPARVRGGDVAGSADQTLAIFQPAELFQRADGHIAIRPDTPGTAGVQVVREWKQAVAQVALGG